MTKQLKVKCECKESKVRSVDPNLCAYSKGNEIEPLQPVEITVHQFYKKMGIPCWWCGEK